MNEKIDVLSLTYEELESKMLEMGEKNFRASQVYDAVFSKLSSGSPIPIMTMFEIL